MADGTTPRRGWYTVQDVLRLLQVKPHVLRYWEQTLPLVRGTRDDAGHRIWSAAQVRMLLRIHHMVVRRGVSVAAAGEAILREATGEGAGVKAGLEHVRSALVVMLLRLQGGGALPRGDDSAGEKQASAGDPLPAELALEPLIHQGLVPPPLPRWRRGVQGPVVVRDRLLQPGVATPAALIVWSHLYARGNPRDIARHVAALVRYRLQDNRTYADLDQVILAVPAEHETMYRREAGDISFHLPIHPARFNNAIWSAPVPGILTALVADSRLDRHLQERNLDQVLLWAADNPHSLADSRLAAAASTRPVGLALGVVCDGSAVRGLSENVAIDLPRWRSQYQRTLAAGRWRTGAVGRPVMRESTDADILTSGDRYDLWIQDLLRVDPALVAVEQAPRPAPWRGAFWLDQLPLIWPELAF